MKGPFVSCVAVAAVVWGAVAASAGQWPPPLVGSQSMAHPEAPAGAVVHDPRGGMPLPSPQPQPPAWPGYGIISYGHQSKLHPPAVYGTRDLHGRYPHGDCDGCQPSWYVAGRVGYAQPFGQTSLGGGLDIRTDFSGGPIGGFSVGRMHRPSIRGRSRIELEFLFGQNNADALNLNIFPQPVDGEIRTFSGMANFLWDFKGQDSTLYPYLGAGVGVASFRTDVDYGPARIEGSDTVAAFQAIAGGVYEFRPHIHFFADVRLFLAGKPSFDHISTGEPPVFGGPAVPGTTRLRSEYHSVSGMVGVMFLLGP